MILHHRWFFSSISQRAFRYRVHFVLGAFNTGKLRPVSKNAMEAHPSNDSDPRFAGIGRFYVEKSAHDVGVRQRTRLAEIDLALDESVIRDTIVPLVTSKSAVSLRVLDWTVTNFSKKHGVTIEHRDHRGNVRLVNVHHEYRSWLRVWRRRLFAPFARRSRIYFRNDDDGWCATTVAQLNFILFAHTLGIIDYVKTNVSTIEKEMNSVLRNRSSNGARAEEATLPPGKRRRTELSEAPPMRCYVFERDIRVVWAGG